MKRVGNNISHPFFFNVTRIAKEQKKATKQSKKPPPPPQPKSKVSNKYLSYYLYTNLLDYSKKKYYYSKNKIKSSLQKCRPKEQLLVLVENDEFSLLKIDTLCMFNKTVSTSFLLL